MYRAGVCIARGRVSRGGVYHAGACIARGVCGGESSATHNCAPASGFSGGERGWRNAPGMSAPAEVSLYLFALLQTTPIFVWHEDV